MSNRFDHRLEHMLESKPGEGDDGVVDVQRIELITGPGSHSGRRRRWSPANKARILLESFEPEVNVSDVARRNGLSPQHLFAWRRAARDLACAGAGEPAVAPPESDRPRDKPTARVADDAPAFARIVTAPAASLPPASPPPGGSDGPGMIEIAMCDVVVRVCGQVDVGRLAAVIRAVRRAS